MTDVNDESGPKPRKRAGRRQRKPKTFATGKNPVTLAEYLKNYPVEFTKDLDQLWREKDIDGNDWLDKEEAYEYVKELSMCIKERERA